MRQALISVWILISLAAHPMALPDDDAKGAQNLKCCGWSREEWLSDDKAQLVR